MRDRYGRKIDYMRISVTDRCNFRCRYCMPDGITQVPMSKILTYEKITEICEAAVSLGITKFKITGGEPLVRLGCPDLVRMIREIPGTEQITMTTNGMLLSEMLPELKRSGLDAVNISLDTLKPEVFRFTTGVDALDRVLGSIQDAVGAGLRVKINSVLQQGVNDGEWKELIRLAEHQPVDVRFIEMMPIGHGKDFTEISNEEIRRRVTEFWPGTREDRTVHGNGPACYLRIPGFLGSIGFISAMHGKFCRYCNRVRLTSQGQLKPCLSFDTGTDLVPFLTGSDEELKEALRIAILEKPEAHCFGETGGSAEHAEHRLMSQIGG